MLSESEIPEASGVSGGVAGPGDASRRSLLKRAPVSMVDFSDSKSDAGLGLLPRLRCAAAAGLGGDETCCVDVEGALVETM